MAKKSGKKQGKLFLFIAGILAATVITLTAAQSIFITASTKSELTEDAKVQFSEFTKAYSIVVKNRIETYFSELEYYIKSDIFETTTDNDEIVQWLRNHEKFRSDKFDYVAWVDKDGNFFSDIGSQTKIPDRDYFQAIMRQGAETFIDNPVTSKTSGQTIVHISKAVRQNGRNIGFFCGVVKIEHISEILADINLGDLGEAYLFASDGNFIAATGDSGAAKNELERMQQRSPESYRNISETWGSKELVAFDGKNGSGKEQLFISAPIEHTNWTILINLEGREVFKAATNVSFKLVLCGVLLIILILLTVGILLFVSIKPLTTVETTIRGIATGDADLTKRIHINANNEIGRVVEGFNLFSEKLQAIIATMKDSKENLVNAGQLLQDSTEDTTSAITQIISNIESMDSQVSIQSNAVHQTAGAVNEIASNIESLNRMIESQSSSVTQASSAVEEMIGNINSVNSSVQKMAEAFQELERKAVVGVQKQNDVNSKIGEIEKESLALQEANAVISGIAEQTNLLAMNAAIEAAHAGEAGKGFSVVADEIRKLSEDSGAQSQTIGTQLAKITGSIEEIVSASQIAADAFNEVSAGINGTNNLVHEITSAMLEQNEGSKQISIALTSMNDTTNEVRTSSFEMSEGNKAILEEIKLLQDSTFSIKDGMDEMSAGARKISETGSALSDLSGQMKESIAQIGNQVDKFKV